MKSLEKIYILFSVVFVLIALVIRPHHDYWAYLEQWDSIIKGDFTSNPYGIVHNLLAYFSKIPFLYAPRALFVAVYLFSGYKLIEDTKSDKQYLILALIILFNPLFLIFGIYYGSNDTFVAGLTLLSILCMIKKRDKTAGVLLAIAIGYKFYPIFILPFLVFKNRNLNKNFLSSFIIVLGLMYLAGFVFWGNSILDPFAIGLDRHSKSLSIFRFIRGAYKPLAIFGVYNADMYSLYLVLASFILSIYLFIFYRLDYLFVALFAYVNVLLFFKVGHHQFFFLFLLLSLLVYLKNQEYIKTNKKLMFAGVSFWILFCFLVVSYPLTGYYDDYLFIREIIGFVIFVPLFVFNVLLIIAAISNSTLK